MIIRESSNKEDPDKPDLADTSVQVSFFWCWLR